jgi:hypothetical protein
MTQFSKKEKIFILTILVLGTTARLISIGWTFLFYFWLFIPTYAALFFGQLFIIRDYRQVTTLQKVIVYISTAFLTFLNFFQVECYDNKCLHLIDGLLSYVDMQLFSTPKDDTMTWAIIILHVVMGVMGVFLILWKPRQTLTTPNIRIGR